MTKEILKDEILNEEQLKSVAGGTFRDSKLDLSFFQACGLLSQDDKPDLYTLTRIT